MRGGKPGKLQVKHGYIVGTFEMGFDAQALVSFIKLVISNRRLSSNTATRETIRNYVYCDIKQVI